MSQRRSKPRLAIVGGTDFHPRLTERVNFSSGIGDILDEPADPRRAIEEFKFLARWMSADDLRLEGLAWLARAQIYPGDSPVGATIRFAQNVATWEHIQIPLSAGDLNEPLGWTPECFQALWRARQLADLACMAYEQYIAYMCLAQQELTGHLEIELDELSCEDCFNRAMELCEANWGSEASS